MSEPVDPWQAYRRNRRVVQIMFFGVSARLISDFSAGRSLGFHRGTWLGDNYVSGGHEMREIPVSEMRQTVLPKVSLVGSGTR